MPRIDVRSLSQQERLERTNDLPESLRAELDRRNAAFPENREHAAPWAKVRTRLRPDGR